MFFTLDAITVHNRRYVAKAKGKGQHEFFKFNQVYDSD